MKKIFIGLLSIFLSLSSLSMSMACEIFKEPIGTSLSSIIDKYDNLDEPPENNAEIYTYHKMYPSWLFCENPYLKETYVEIYIREGKIADINIIDFDSMRLHRPEAIFDLPAGGRRPVSYTHLTLPTIYSV